MTQLLKLAQFLDQHGMPKMQVGRGRIEARFYYQRNAGRECFCQLPFQLLFDQHFDGAALDDGQLFGYGHIRDSLKLFQQGIFMRSILTALPLDSSTPITTALRRMSFLATSNLDGSWVKKR